MNTILRIADGGPGTGAGAPPQLNPTRASLEAENTALKSRLKVYQDREAQQLADETLISEKMRTGLRRPQAIAVIQRQRDYDALMKKQAGEKKAKDAAKAAGPASAGFAAK